MEQADQRKALAAAVNAARAVGALMRANLREIKTVNSSTQHDIKLELDVRSQKLIEKKLATAFPDIALLGEEGEAGSADAGLRWVVDPIDGTVNFTYGIPHACVSIALQAQSPESGVQSPKSSDHGLATRQESRITHHASRITHCETLLGVVYDPFTDELWTGIRGQAARLNGRVIHVSPRQKLPETIVAIGFAKTRQSLEKTLPFFNRLVPRVRKVRIMGSAALALAYVATGRFDAYIERGISLWDIAAGGLIVECAGGEFWREPIQGEHKFRMIASNGRLRRQLSKGWI